MGEGVSVPVAREKMAWLENRQRRWRIQDSSGKLSRNTQSALFCRVTTQRNPPPIRREFDKTPLRYTARHTHTTIYETRIDILPTPTKAMPHQTKRQECPSSAPK